MIPFEPRYHKASDGQQYASEAGGSGFRIVRRTVPHELIEAFAPDLEC